MDLSIDRIPFPEEEYTVPKVIEIIANYRGIYLEDKKSTDKLYRAMAQRIRDELKNKEIAVTGNQTRRSTFPKAWIDEVVNTTLAEYFCKAEAGQKNSLRKKWKELTDDYIKKCEDGTYQDEENEYYKTEFSESPDIGSKMLFESVQDYKRKILEEIVFKHLVKLDEELLKRDAAVSLTFSDNHLPTPEDMGAMERLQDLSNYYKWRNKELADFFKN